MGALSRPAHHRANPTFAAEKNMGEHDDSIFIRRFSGIIAGLVIVTILIIIISVGTDSPEPGANPSREILAAERVAPVAGVRTELAEPEAAPVATVQENATQQSAQADAGADGSAVFNSTCGVCHLSGVADAPIPGSEAWAEIAANGIDALTANAIAGMGVMPPKGGRLDLSDDEVRAAVEYMLAQ